MSGLPGSHLDNFDEGQSPSESIVQVIQRMFLKSFTWIGIYLLGFYDFSIAWLITPLFLSALRSQWKKERDAKLSSARQAALTNEKEMIETRIRVEDLPSWVFFPDKERAEWVNAIIYQLWPNVGHYTRKLISESIEPSIKTALEAYKLNGFRFERVVLGQVPPRITGIKVYERNISRNEIIVDMDLVFASDCDIKFCLGKMKAKIMDFSLRGMIRIVLKPIVNEIPLIGGLQAYFLSNPDIDFDLGGIANAFDAPGLSNIIRKIVLEQIGYLMVLPHKFTMPLMTTVENRVLKCPDSAGVLRVWLHKAVQLEKKDVGVLGKSKSDPYAVLSVGARSVRTPRINNTVNPEWNYVADFPIEVVKGQELILEIYDHDDPGEDEFLGRATVQTNIVSTKGEINYMWVELEDVESGRAQMSLAWLETSKKINDLSKASTSQIDLDNVATCLLHVYVDSCKNLVVSRSSALRPSPRIELRVGQESQTTFPQYHNPDPIFEQGFVFLVASPEADDLHIRVIDVGHSDKIICQTTIRLSDILEKKDMELESQPIQLKGGANNSSITISANIRVLLPSKKSSDRIEEMHKINESASETSGIKSPKKMATAREDFAKSAPAEEQETKKIDASSQIRHRVAPLGKVKITILYNQDNRQLKVTIHQATGLPGSNLPDPPDPYIKLYILPDRSKKTKRKTEVVKDTTEPIYEEVFKYDMDFKYLDYHKLEVTVIDRKGIFARNPIMGRVVIDLNNPKLLNGGITDWFFLDEADEDSDE